MGAERRAAGAGGRRDRAKGGRACADPGDRGGAGELRTRVGSARLRRVPGGLSRQRDGVAGVRPGAGSLRPRGVWIVVGLWTGVLWGLWEFVGWLMRR